MKTHNVHMHQFGMETQSSTIVHNFIQIYSYHLLERITNVLLHSFLVKNIKKANNL
jgi:hypothetical protein